jgi:hypothetical protein
MRREGHGEIKNTCKNVIERHEGNDTHRQEQHSKMNITESRWSVVDWIQLAQDQPRNYCKPSGEHV